MRLLFASCIAAAALALAAPPALAGSCCRPMDFDGPPRVPFEAAPIYIVDEGPVVSGPGVYAYHDIYVPRVYAPPLALPPEGGYAAVVPFPYIHRVTGLRRGYRR